MTIPLYNAVNPSQIFAPGVTIRNFSVALVNDLIKKINLEVTTLNVNTFGAVGNGVTDDTAAIIAAVAAASSAGAFLGWPTGTYLTTASIPLLHSVINTGPGIIKRGSDLFYITPPPGVQNTLFVRTDGANGNDGISDTAASSFLTIQAAIDAWAKYARNTEGNWRIKLAAGTWTEGGLADGVISPTVLTVEGASRTTTIIDGTGAVKIAGLHFNAGVRALVKNLKTQDFQEGIAVENGSICTIDSCNAAGNTLYGFAANEFSDMNVIGNCTVNVPAGARGIRYYRQSTGSIIPNTAIIIDGDNTVCDGLQVRDNSYIVCTDGLTIQNCDNIGVHIWKHSYVELRATTLSNNENAIQADEFGLYANLSGVVTFTGNTKNYNFSGFSIRQADAGNVLLGPDGPSGDLPTSDYDVVIDNNGASGIQALLANGIFNIDANKKERISFVNSDNTLRFTLNAVDTYRMRLDGFVPVTNNTHTLGASGFRWSEVFAVNGVINTSDERLKTEIQPISDAVLDAWSEVEYVSFKFTASVKKKGDKARTHFGVIVQRIIEVFEKYNLSSFDYGLVCYDKWDDGFEVNEKGEKVQVQWAGDEYGVRLEQCLVLEAALLRRSLKRLTNGNQS